MEGTDALTLRSTEFRKGREAAWRQLEGLISRIDESGIGSLSAEETELLPLLHRNVMSSLSVARNIVLDRNLLLYLEDLALRSYLIVYGPRTGILHNLSVFFRQDFPRLVRSLRWHILLIFLFEVVSGIAGYALVRSDLSYFDMLIPETVAQSRGPGSSAEDLREVLFAPWPGFVKTFVAFGNYLFRHNTMVGIFSFALGFAFGVPTILLVIYNSLILGAFIALHAEKGLTIAFVGWLSIHGVTELLAFILLGAAGVAIGEKIIFPGPLPRIDSLAIHGRKAASVAAGAIFMLFIASILEGGFRQLITNTPARYGFAFVTAAFWLFYFTRVGRPQKKEADDRGHSR